MTVDTVAVRRARWILNTPDALRLFHDPNVAMIDVGYPEREGVLDTNNLTIRFHVREKLSDFGLEAAIALGKTEVVLPKRLGEFETDVQENTFQPNFWWTAPAPVRTGRAARTDPLEGGISVSDAFRTTYGTLGGLVVDRQTQAPMILSNWHVLAVGWGAQPLHAVYQPGRLDGGKSADVVAHFTRHAMFENIDAAVARLVEGGRPGVNMQYDLGVVRGAASPELGMRVVKSGRKTGVTYGVVVSVGGMVKIRYNGMNRVVYHTASIVPRIQGGIVSSGGDSGSFWLEESTMKAVGLHFAGSDRVEQALAIDMPHVLNALDVDLLL